MLAPNPGTTIKEPGTAQLDYERDWGGHEKTDMDLRPYYLDDWTDGMRGQWGSKFSRERFESRLPLS